MPENVSPRTLDENEGNHVAFESIYYLQSWLQSSEKHMMTYILWLDIFIFLLVVTGAVLCLLSLACISLCTYLSLLETIYISLETMILLRWTTLLMRKHRTNSLYTTREKE